MTFVQGESTDETVSHEDLDLNYIKFSHIFRSVADDDKSTNTGSPLEVAQSSNTEICKYYNRKVCFGVFFVVSCRQREL